MRNKTLILFPGTLLILLACFQTVSAGFVDSTFSNLTNSTGVNGYTSSGSTNNALSNALKAAPLTNNTNSTTNNPTTITPIESLSKETLVLPSRTITTTQSATISSLSLSPTPFVPEKSNLTVGYNINNPSKENLSLSLLVTNSRRITRFTKRMYLGAADGSGSQTYDGKDSTGADLKDGDYQMTVTLTDRAGTTTKGTLSGTFTLQHKLVQGTAGDVPVLMEVTPVTTPSTNTTPTYVFSSSKAGTISYGGLCHGDKTTAVQGNNVLTFTALQPGTYSNCIIKVTYNPGTFAITNNSVVSDPLTVSSFTITAADDNSDQSGSGDNSGTETGNTGTGSTPYSETVSTGSGSDSAAAAAMTAESTGTAPTDVVLKVSPDIMNSHEQANTLYFENDAPAYDNLALTVALNKTATVNVSVYKDAFDPKAEDNSDNLVKTIMTDTRKKTGTFNVTWDGYDDYDQAVPLAKYKFVVEARLSDDYKPDISIQSFEIKNAPTETPAANTATAENVQNPSSDNLHGAASTSTGATTTATSTAAAPATTSSTTGSTEQPGLLQQINTAIFGPEQPITEGASTTEVTAANLAARVPSKCPNSFYPIDISGSPYESLIKKAYDECLVVGYPDGTFRHQTFITRPEAVVIADKAAGIEAVKGCYDNDCGSPFMDLVPWESPWVRAAWNAGIVSGIAPDQFGQGQITRAEAAALLAKAFKIAPFDINRCYTFNCGAGYPDNFFTDIMQSWQGPYLRALWDKGVIQTVTPGKFYPDRPLSRAQFLDMLMQVKSLQPSA